MRVVSRLVITAAVLACPEGSIRAALAGQPPAVPNGRPRAEVQLLPVQGNVYLLAGPGGNVTIQAGKDGVLLVDTMIEALAPRIAAEAQKLSPLPIRYIIDTNVDADHIGGNAALASMGAVSANA